MNEEDVVSFWEAQAEEWDQEGNSSVISDALAAIARESPHLLRGATEAAARAVARRFCTHGAAPQPLPDIRSVGERKTAAQQHPGLCGVHHAQYIGGVSYDTIVERAAGAPISTKNLRNQASMKTTVSQHGVCTQGSSIGRHCNSSTIVWVVMVTSPNVHG